MNAIRRTIWTMFAATALSATAIAQEPRPERNSSPTEILTGEREPAEAKRDEIETDRDSFTPATTTAGRRRLIVEAAYSFFDNRDFADLHSYPELILRYGLTDRLELRVGWNRETGGEIPGFHEEELSYGFKYAVSEQCRWIPRSAIILQAFMPTGGSVEASPATDIVATYVAGWEFPNRWRFDMAFRYGSNGEAGDRWSDWAPSAVVRVPFGERWAAHCEYIGIFTTDKAENRTQHFVSPGIHCLVTPDLEIGVRLGWGLNDQSARFFSNVGFGWRY